MKKLSQSAQDEFFMRRALALAKRGGNRVSPNPQVGCVLVKSGRVVAEGWHAVFGGPHAEAVALRKAGKRARGSTAYVNLEPCCHLKKKTPPCVPALLRAHVRRVVVGMKDPNPRVSGKGIQALRRAGIQVTAGILGDKALALNRPFTVRVKKNRPYVILKAATSLDGKIETNLKESKWITSPEARAASHRMRTEADAILVGINTVLNDDPNLTSHGHGKNPLRVILDTRLKIPPTARVLNGKAPTLIVTSKQDFSLSRALPRDRAIVIYVPKRGAGIDLEVLLKLLFKMDIGTVLVEGGSSIHTSFLEAGLIDEVRLFMAPRLLGGNKARTFFEGKGIRRLKDSPWLKEASVTTVGPDFLITGYLN